MKTVVMILILAFAQTVLATEHILIVQGASGDNTYDAGFTRASDQWVALATDANANVTKVGEPNLSSVPKEEIHSWISSPERDTAASLWIVYIGHGSFRGGEAKLNLAGADLSATELAAWLEPFNKEFVFIHGGSASSPFIKELSAPNRVVISATKSGNETNYARFGERFIEMMGDPSTDIDLDGSVSLLEAFLKTSNAVESFYLEAGRLSTEHALLDDNGDSKGTLASQFEGLRPTEERASEHSDGRLAKHLSLAPNRGMASIDPQQSEERNRLEQELEALYLKKGDMGEKQYFESLEAILDKLAKIYLDGSDT